MDVALSGILIETANIFVFMTHSVASKWVGKNQLTVF